MEGRVLANPTRLSDVRGEKPDLIMFDRAQMNHHESTPTYLAYPPG